MVINVMDNFLLIGEHVTCPISSVLKLHVFKCVESEDEHDDDDDAILTILMMMMVVLMLMQVC